MTTEDFWTDGLVAAQATVWDNAYGEPIPDHAHEMGTLFKGTKVHVIELYPDDNPSWARFDRVDTATATAELEPFDDRYKEYWVKVEHFFVDRAEDPQEPEDPVVDEPTDEPTNEEIGKVIRFLFHR